MSKKELKKEMFKTSGKYKALSNSNFWNWDIFKIAKAIDELETKTITSKYNNKKLKIEDRAMLEEYKKIYDILDY